MAVCTELRKMQQRAAKNKKVSKPKVTTRKSKPAQKRPKPKKK